MSKSYLINLLPFIALLHIVALQTYAAQPSGIDTLPPGCTIVTISKGERVFFGGNDDYINPDSYYWVDPGDSTRYGVIWIGTPDNPQQGVNEKGLAYDANGLTRVDVNPHTERIPVPGGYHNYVITIMHECSSVEEVINWVNSHQRYPYMHDQLHFADTTGDAVIISPGKDGEMVFTRKAPGDGFLVSTNFNVANPSRGINYPCWRYDKAQDLSGQLIDREEPIDFRDVTDIMDGVHVEASTWTLETMVADLVNGLVYAYYFYQYDRPVVLNVKKELSNPREPGPLSELFPEDVQQEASKRYDKVTINLKTNKVVGISWPAMVFVSLILLFTISSEFRKSIRFWLPAVVILGPIALIAGYLAFKRCKTTSCRHALIETLGSLIPLVVSYTAAFTILILSLLSGNTNWQIQVIPMVALPIIVAWVFHVVFLSPISQKNLGQILTQCLPLVLVTTFLGMGGITSIALPLEIKSLAMSLLSPLSPLAVMTWWAIFALGALPGGVLIYLYERWAVKRSYQSWTICAGGDVEIIMPGWSKLWWWLLLSIAVLLAGSITGIVLGK